jgi:hypothetical protein
VPLAPWLWRLQLLDRLAPAVMFLSVLDLPQAAPADPYPCKPGRLPVAVVEMSALPLAAVLLVLRVVCR